MQPNFSSTFRLATLEQAGAAAEDNVAPGSVKIGDPLYAQAPGARRLRRPLRAVAARQPETQAARTAVKQPGRAAPKSDNYQPR